MKVFVFVDSNVLLQYRLFDQVDWARELGVLGATLVFAPVVFSELDTFKWGGTRRQKDRARAVLKKLNALALTTTPVPVREAVQALALDAEPEDALFVQHRLSAQSKDDRLLASYLGFVAEHPRARVMILSADSGLATKARSRRIELIAPDDALELPDEPDEVERELEKVRRELADAQRATPDLKLTFGDGQTLGDFDVQLVTPIDARTLGRLLQAWRKQYPHRAATPQSVTGFGGVDIKLPDFARIPGFATEKDAAAHNAAIDEFSRKYEAFLRSWHLSVNAHRRILSFELVLENAGTAPADSVDLLIWTDADGVWLDDVPKPPRAPALKVQRSPFDMRIPRMPGLTYPPNIRSPFVANENGPNISGKGAEQRVQYTIKQAMHHVRCTLPVVYFQFASDEAVRSFHLHARLVAANIRKPVTTQLHVKITLPEQSPPPPPPQPTEEYDD